MENQIEEAIVVLENADDNKEFDTLDYVKELFLHAVEQQKSEKKRLRTARITMILIACMLAVFVAAALVLVPPVTRAITEAQSVLEKVNALDLATLSEDVNGFIEQANSSLQSVGDAAEQLQSLDIDTMNEAIGSLSTTVESFSKIDIDTLNEAINNLNETVTPFAKFFEKFK